MIRSTLRIKKYKLPEKTFKNNNFSQRPKASEADFNYRRQLRMTFRNAIGGSFEDCNARAKKLVISRD
jgi:hypothetical protein